jgi:hypothetical protein
MLDRISTLFTTFVLMAKKIKLPADINKRAKSIVDLATGGEEPDTSGKNPAAVALGRLGGLKGGKARAESLTAKKRSEIAKGAAAARWHKK